MTWPAVENVPLTLSAQIPTFQMLLNWSWIMILVIFCLVFPTEISTNRHHTRGLLRYYVRLCMPRLLGSWGGWGGGGVVGWGGIITSLARPHIRDATLLYALLHFIHIHTNLMLHVLHLQTDLMLRCKMSLALAHILDATL